ncbi:MAG: ATP-binding protein [Oceanicaulis sp.]|nr:ATP-binding protein [Oceanicaulis sp.]
MNAVAERLSRTLDRNLNAIASVAVAVKAYADAVLDDDGAAAVELALVEVLTNAIKHSGLRSRAAGQIAVSAHVDGRELVVEVCDCAPLAPEALLEKARDKRVEVSVDDIALLEESGRGLSIIVLTMDEVTLHTDHDHYVLRMVKYTIG